MGKTFTFSALVISCIALAVIPTFFVSAVFFGENQVARNPAPLTPGKTVTQPPHNVAEPVDAFAKLASQRTFRARVSTTHLSRPAVEGKFEYIAPDRFHGIFDAIEMLSIGPSVFVRTNSKWIPVNVKMSLCFISPTDLLSNYKSATDRQYVGDEKLDGFSTSIFQYKLTCSDSGEIVRLWIGNTPSDGLPHKLESTAENGTKTTVGYYDFSANFTIPSPTP